MDDDLFDLWDEHQEMPDDNEWHPQHHSDTCAIAAQEGVLEDVGGVRPPEDEMIVVAEREGWYTPGGGTPMLDVGRLLAYYGLEVSQHVHADLGSLHDALDRGDGVIVGLRAETLAGEPDDLDLAACSGIPGQTADHAVRVVGFEGHDVVLDDPARGVGAVPVEVFLESWRESGNFMVTAAGGRS